VCVCVCVCVCVVCVCVCVCVHVHSISIIQASRARLCVVLLQLKSCAPFLIRALKSCAVDYIGTVTCCPPSPKPNADPNLDPNPCALAALILRAFSVIEGIGLGVDPDYAIVKECFPYLSRCAKRQLSNKIV